MLFKMRQDNILLNVYKISSLLIALIVLLTCSLFRWPLSMIILAVLAASVIGSPAVISLQIVIWLYQRIHFERIFMWMLLLSVIPLLSLIAAWLFADFVPGKIWFILLLGMFSSYLAISKHAVSVSKLFNAI